MSATHPFPPEELSSCPFTPTKKGKPKKERFKYAPIVALLPVARVLLVLVNRGGALVLAVASRFLLGCNIAFSFLNSFPKFNLLFPPRAIPTHMLVIVLISGFMYNINLESNIYYGGIQNCFYFNICGIKKEGILLVLTGYIL